MPKTELFVGNLDRDVSKRDLEDVFTKYGSLVRCDIKSKDVGQSFCFLEFEEERDAEVSIFHLKKKKKIPKKENFVDIKKEFEKKKLFGLTK